MSNTGPSAAVVRIVKGRLDGLCLRACGSHGVMTHHRRPRGSGGTSDPATNRPDNLAWICVDCNEFIERRERKRAEAAGWLVRHGIDEPYQIALTDQLGAMFFLDQEGEIVPLAAPNQSPF